MDSHYLQQHVGKALALGLAEICQKKPTDPIEYLSKWLRKHVENLGDDAKEALAAEELGRQREHAEEEKLRQDALLEEQNQIAKEILKRDMEKLDQEQQEKQQSDSQEPPSEQPPKLQEPTQQLPELQEPSEAAPEEAQNSINTASPTDSLKDSADVNTINEERNNTEAVGDDTIVEASAEISNSDDENDDKPAEAAAVTPGAEGSGNNVEIAGDSPAATTPSGAAEAGNNVEIAAADAVVTENVENSSGEAVAKEDVETAAESAYQGDDNDSKQNGDEPEDTVTPGAGSEQITPPDSKAKSINDAGLPSVDGQNEDVNVNDDLMTDSLNVDDS